MAHNYVKRGTVSAPSTYARYGVPQHHHLVPHTLAPGTPLYITMGPSMVCINLVSITFSHRPDKTMVKACLHSYSFLFLRKLKEYFLLIIGYKQYEKPTSTTKFSLPHMHITL